MVRLVALVVVSAVAARDAPKLPPAEEARRDALARYGLGLLRARNDRPAEAVKHLEAAARSDPDSPEPLKPLVQLYADLGRDAAAIRTAKKVLELDPADADTAHTLGKLYYDAKRYADAVAALKQASESPRLAKQPAKRYGVLRDLGRAAEAARDWIAAEVALTEAARLTSDPRELAAVRERLGHALTERKQYAEATAAYAEARTLFEKQSDRSAAARIHWNLSGVLSAQGKVDDAIAELSKFLALRPSGAAPYERLADLLRRAGLGSRVPATLAKYVDDNPTNEAIRWVHAAELGHTNARAAEELFRDLAETATDTAHFPMLVRFHKEANRLTTLLDLSDRLFQTARGTVRGRDKPPEGFVAKPADVARARALADAIKAEPNLSGRLLKQAAGDARTGVGRAPDTWDLLSGLAERDGELAVAELVLRQLVRSGGSDDSRFRLLENLAKQRKWADLRAEAVLQVNQGSTSFNPRYFQAVAHAELGEAAAAVAAINAVVDKTQGASWARSRKAYILNVLGRHQEAVGECTAMVADFAADPVAVRQARIALSNSYLGLKKYGMAEAELRTILEDDPDDMLILNNLGYNLADQGRKLDEAELMIRRALELDAEERRRAGDPEGESGTYLDSLAWVLFRRGRVAEAREILEKVARLPETAGDAVVWDHLGDVRFRDGAAGAAREAWERAAELYKNSHQGKQGGRRDEVLRKLEQTR